MTSYRRHNAGGELTYRGLEVLSLAAQGLTNAQIGRTLLLSPLTVKTHLKWVYAKLQSSNRAHAVFLALRNGLIAWEYGLSGWAVVPVTNTVRRVA